MSYKPDLNAVAIDAFNMDWSTLNFYAFPPFNVISPMLNKIRMDKARGICVIPDWPTQGWYPMVMQMQEVEPVHLKAKKGLLTLPSHPTEQHPLHQKTKPTGASIIRERIKQHGLSSSTTDIVMASWCTGTRKQYSLYLTKWQSYCENEGLSMFDPGMMHAVEILGSLYHLYCQQRME